MTSRLDTRGCDAAVATVRRGMRAAALALAVIAAAAGAVRAQPTPPPPPPPAAPVPAAEFFRAATVEQVTLSPSGRWLAMTAAVGSDHNGLVIFDVQTWKPTAVVARYGDADISGFWWHGDDRLVYTLHDRERGVRDLRFGAGLFSVRRDGSEMRQYVRLNWEFVGEISATRRELLNPNHVLLHVPAGGDEGVIIGEYVRTSTGDFSHVNPKRLNPSTGRTTSLAVDAPERAWGWIFDAKGEPRVAQTLHQGRTTFHWRGPGDQHWRQLADFPARHTDWQPAFVDNSGELFVRSESKGTGMLKRFDFARNAPTVEPLVSVAGFSFTGGIVSEVPGSRALGVRAFTDAETTVWFDPPMTALQKAADTRLPGHVNRIACRRCAQPDMVALVFAWSDRDPGQYWFHSAASAEWRKVGDQRPGIDPRRMGATDFHRIRARDGADLPLWITQPAGARKGDAPRPAVVWVHGGPWVRGRTWAWGDQTQFLASRGYVVVEPEFRGSSGYGSAHLRAGFRQWGQAMQDDVADALQWAVAQGLVDPKRVCIAGASYGGYSTLMGLARHPELYRCGIAIAAVTDPRLMFEWRRDSDFDEEGRRYSYPEMVGDPVADAEMLRRVAPVENVGRISAPLLLVHGRVDRRVPPVHAERLRDALSAAGRPPQYVEYADEGHGLNLLANRIDLAARMEAFLARHLKAD